MLNALNKQIVEGIFCDYTDAIAHAETKKVPLRAVSFDSQSAFDKITHNYLQEILPAHGIGNLFVNRIMGLYRNAGQKCKLTDLDHPNPNPQVDTTRLPSTNATYTLCLNPLLHKLEENQFPITLIHNLKHRMMQKWKQLPSPSHTQPTLPLRTKNGLHSPSHPHKSEKSPTYSKNRNKNSIQKQQYTGPPNQNNNQNKKPTTQ